MKLHFISKSYGVPLAFQAEQTGARASLHLSGLHCGAGMFTRVPTPQPASRTDAVVVDGPGWGKLVEELKADGNRVLFGGKWPELVALDAKFHKSVMDKAGQRPVPGEAQRPPYKLLVGGWYEGGWRKPFYKGVIHDRLLAGDLGAPSGPTACQVAPVDEHSHLVEWFLHPLSEQLGAAGYAGLVSIFVVRHEDGLYCDGVSIGVQPAVIEAVSEMVYGGLAALLSGDATPSGDCACAIVLTMPWYPVAVAKPDAPVAFKLDSGQRKRFWPLDVSLVGGEYVYGAEVGILGSVTARGRPERPTDGPKPWCVWHKEATHRAYKTIGRFGVEGVQYRNDLGRDTGRLLAALDN